MKILAIDPGTSTSGVVFWDCEKNEVSEPRPDVSNDFLLSCVRKHAYGLNRNDRVVCEWIQCMGMPAGKEVFETCRFIGQLQEAFWLKGFKVEYIQRPTVKTRLCGSPRAKDPNVRQALIDRLGPVGTKKNKGPLFGVSSHAWSALACAIAIDLK